MAKLLNQEVRRGRNLQDVEYPNCGSTRHNKFNVDGASKGKLV